MYELLIDGVTAATSISEEFAWRMYDVAVDTVDCSPVDISTPFDIVLRYDGFTISSTTFCPT